MTETSAIVRDRAQLRSAKTKENAVRIFEFVPLFFGLMALLPKLFLRSQIWMYFPRMAKKKKPAKVRTTALMRAERGTAPVHLAAAETHLLDRALAEGQTLRDTMEDALLRFGRWVLVEVFDNDTAKALDDHTDNPVWMELVRRAGGPTLGVSRTLLYIALRVAANDKRVTDQSWQRMDIGRKQLLLPLREPPALRHAAQHVMRLNLTQAKTKEYVTQLLESDGKKRQVRLTRAGLLSRVRKLRDGLAGAAVLKRAGQLKMSDKQRAEVVREMAALRDLLDAVSQAVEGG